MAWAYFAIFSVLAVLRYLSLHSTVLDLAVYDNGVWRIAYLGEVGTTAIGHLSPILVLFAPLYWIVDSPVGLLVAQAAAIAASGWVLFELARPVLESDARALVIELCYFLYPALEFNTLYDYHPDHLILLVLLAGFYFVERGKRWGFVLSLLPGLLVKESLLFAVAGMGCYALVRKKWIKEGAGTVVVALSVYAAYATWGSPLHVDGLAEEGFGHLGAMGPVAGLAMRPWAVLGELATSPDKIAFILSLLYPLLFMPLASPVALMPSIPHLVMSIVSHTPAHASVCGHYTASVIPGIFVAALFGVRRLRRLGRAAADRVLVAMLGVSLYYNIIQSPSPLSMKFWVLDNWYHRSSYVISNRDREVVRLIRTTIPRDVDVTVCSQNTLNHAVFAHRRELRLFPEVRGADYVVLDTRRPLCLMDKAASRAEFLEKLGEIRPDYETVVEWDGLLILRRAAKAGR